MKKIFSLWLDNETQREPIDKIAKLKNMSTGAFIGQLVDKCITADQLKKESIIKK